MNTYKYYKIYKPYGMLSQFTGGHGQAVLGELHSFPKDIYPVGRLDSDSEGLLLLTNDKRINNLLLDPKNGHKRTYWSQVEGIATEEAVKILENGVTISIEGKEYHTKPAKTKLISEPKNLPERKPPVRFRLNKPTSWIELTLTEGKNRQVRRMTAKAGFPTLRLLRVSIEGIKLDKMQPGDVQEMDKTSFIKQLGLSID
ncbi:MAG: pseudouridine synthase [Cytophagaceae bacterium]